MRSTKFIIKELDDTHLWVKPDKDKIEFIQEKVKEFNNLNVSHDSSTFESDLQMHACYMQLPPCKDRGSICHVG